MNTSRPVGTCCCGLTLLELLLVLAIMALLSRLGNAGFRRVILDARMTREVNAIVGAIHLARQRANQALVPVTVCAGNPQCDPDGTWALGWTVFVNRDGDDPPQIDLNEPILITHPPWRTGRISANRRAFSFRPFSLHDTNGTIVFCGPRGKTFARAVVISPIGRPRLASREEVNKRITCNT